MKEAEKLESVREDWACDPGAEDQSLHGGPAKSCELFFDSLLAEAQKVSPECSPSPERRQADVSIKLWKNGFTVNDEFHSYRDGASQQFLNAVRKGELPSELQGMFDKEEVDVKVEEKKEEVYVSKKPTFQPFSGLGHRLGSATPRVVSKVSSSDCGNPKALISVPLNPSEPITSIQIWLADGKRLVQRFNVSHRVSHVRDFIRNYEGSHRNWPFTLVTALPALKLLDDTLTLEEADLQNAVVIQRRQTAQAPLQGLS
ncbi:UBX domain-containing protein 2A [Vombatus ursinus]|uniref:UBX domain-containing protein 2A n=1 Tax=Vombatus ursinus TaxID=29139 RepID=A0A4X2KDY4_VOMUR|nr:UBX domain-containing protein 2A [Vombatus ursinus]XP_027713834.1 UBX domain-containing protein 2A [Vombatus ursinus]